MSRSLLFLALAALGGCSDMCADRVVRSAVAPDGRHAAVVFVRDCGATTDYSTQVSILPPGDAPTNAGTVFVATSGTSAPAPWGGPEAEVRWLGADRLLVSYAGGAEVFRRLADRDEVRVAYRARGPS